MNESKRSDRENAMGAEPQLKGLRHLMDRWTEAELNAFFCCVREKEAVPAPNSREELISRSQEEFFWAYNSKLRANAACAAAKAAFVAYELLPENMKKRTPKPTPLKPLHEYATALSYEKLLRECCKELKIEKSESEPHDLLEMYLAEKVIILAVSAMTAQQRHIFLTRKVELQNVSAGFPKTDFKGAATTLAALGVAQASGFGVYLAATTALGFLSHAVGITLPFAVYTGMTSTIAFLIGPAGFLAAGAWLGWQLTGPEWTRICRGLLHIIAMRAKYHHQNLALTTAASAG